MEGSHASPQGMAFTTGCATPTAALAPKAKPYSPVLGTSSGRAAE